MKTNSPLYLIIFVSIFGTFFRYPDNKSSVSQIFISFSLAQEKALFPPAVPESQGVSSSALNKFTDKIRQHLDDELIVGAELVVIKNRYLILHECFGWKDREDKIPMKPNTIFNVRSMTKTLTGAAAQILIDEKKLNLADPVCNYVPGFNNEKSKSITIEQLLTHRSGLPLTILKTANDYKDLISMANAIGEKGPQFKPGSKFWYSDAGTDVLGAVVEKVSGMLLDRFVQEHLLEPLGMKDTFYPFNMNDPRWERIATLYGGIRKAWVRFWSPDSASFYPFAWGSQSLYSTPLDYARFLAMWMNKGKCNGRQILSEEAVERTLTPVSVMSTLGSDMPYPTGFPNLKAHYGQMAILYLQEESTDNKPFLIGHSGSDGTYAWAWPDLDLIILYFTQSRGSASGIRLETEIDKLLINPLKEKEIDGIPDKYKAYLGTYVANFSIYRNTEFSVLFRNGRLAVDIPGQIVYELKDPDINGKWYFALTNEVYVTFDKDDTGNITGMRMYQAGLEFKLPKGTASPEPELDTNSVKKYLGFYHDKEADQDVEIKIQNNHLAVDVPGLITFELLPPDENNRWFIRMRPNIWLKFNEAEGGIVISVTRSMGGKLITLPRVKE